MKNQKQSPSESVVVSVGVSDGDLDALMPEPEEKGEPWRDEYGSARHCEIVPLTTPSTGAIFHLVGDVADC